MILVGQKVHVRATNITTPLRYHRHYYLLLLTSSLNIIAKSSELVYASRKHQKMRTALILNVVSAVFTILIQPTTAPETTAVP